MNYLRGIGALSVLLGAGGVLFALRPVDAANGRGWILAVIGPLAVVLGSIALAKMHSLNAFDRIASAIGAGLGTIGTVGLVAVLAGVWSGIPEQTADALPTVPTVSQAAPTPQVSPEQERLDLVQAAGTFNYLVTQDAAATGSYPDLVAATSTGFLILPAGTVQLPAGATASYVPAADGSAYVLTLIGATGAVAILDSALGTIESSIP